MTEEKKMDVAAPAVKESVAGHAVVDSPKADAPIMLAQAQVSPSDAKPLDKMAPIVEKK